MPAPRGPALRTHAASGTSSSSSSWPAAARDGTDPASNVEPDPDLDGQHLSTESATNGKTVLICTCTPEGPR